MTSFLSSEMTSELLWSACNGLGYDAVAGYLSTEIAEYIFSDIVYIGTIHILHYEHTKLMLNCGKHVLCEKPMALNTKQAQKMIELAQKKGLFFMEVGKQTSSMRNCE